MPPPHFQSVNAAGGGQVGGAGGLSGGLLASSSSVSSSDLPRALRNTFKDCMQRIRVALVGPKKQGWGSSSLHKEAAASQSQPSSTASNPAAAAAALLASPAAQAAFGAIEALKEASPAAPPLQQDNQTASGLASSAMASASSSGLHNSAGSGQASNGATGMSASSSSSALHASSSTPASGISAAAAATSAAHTRSVLAYLLHHAVSDIFAEEMDQSDSARLSLLVSFLSALSPLLDPRCIVMEWWDVLLRPMLKDPQAEVRSADAARGLVVYAMASTPASEYKDEPAPNAAWPSLEEQQNANMATSVPLAASARATSDAKGSPGNTLSKRPSPSGRIHSGASGPPPPLLRKATAHGREANPFRKFCQRIFDLYASEASSAALGRRQEDDEIEEEGEEREARKQGRSSSTTSRTDSAAWTGSQPDGTTTSNASHSPFPDPNAGEPPIDVVGTTWKGNLEAIVLTFGLEKPKAFFHHLAETFEADPMARIPILLLLTIFLRLNTINTYHITSTSLPRTLVLSAQLDTSTTCVSLCITALVILLPHIPNWVAHGGAGGLPALLAVLARVIDWRRLGVGWETRAEEGEEMERQRRELDEDHMEVLRIAKRLKAKPQLGWRRLETSFDTASSAPPDCVQFFTFVYGIFPCNVIRFLRSPVTYLRAAKYESPFEADWDEIIEVASIQSRAASIIRRHALHPALISLTAEKEIGDKQRWMEHDAADITAECINLYLGAWHDVTMPTHPAAAQELERYGMEDVSVPSSSRRGSMGGGGHFSPAAAAVALAAYSRNRSRSGSATSSAAAAQHPMDLVDAARQNLRLQNMLGSAVLEEGSASTPSLAGSFRSRSVSDGQGRRSRSMIRASLLDEVAEATRKPSPSPRRERDTSAHSAVRFSPLESSEATLPPLHVEPAAAPRRNSEQADDILATYASLRWGVPLTANGAVRSQRAAAAEIQTPAGAATPGSLSRSTTWSASTAAELGVGAGGAALFLSHPSAFGGPSLASIAMTPTSSTGAASSASHPVAPVSTAPPTMLGAQPRSTSFHVPPVRKSSDASSGPPSPSVQADPTLRQRTGGRARTSSLSSTLSMLPPAEPNASSITVVGMAPHHRPSQEHPLARQVTTASSTAGSSSNVTSPSARPARSEVYRELAYLQRENLLLRNELNFELYLKEQHLRHIGRLHRDRLTDTALEAERQNLYQSVRNLRSQVANNQEERERQRAKMDSMRARHAAWETDLNAKLKFYREERKNWTADVRQLRAELEDVKATSASQAKQLEQQGSELFGLRIQVEKDGAKVAKVAEYEAKIAQLTSCLELWDEDTRKYEEQRRQMELLLERWKEMEMILEATDAELEHAKLCAEASLANEERLATELKQVKGMLAERLNASRDMAHAPTSASQATSGLPSTAGLSNGSGSAPGSGTASGGSGPSVLASIPAVAALRVEAAAAAAAGAGGTANGSGGGSDQPPSSPASSAVSEASPSLAATSTTSAHASAHHHHHHHGTTTTTTGTGGSSPRILPPHRLLNASAAQRASEPELNQLRRRAEELEEVVLDLRTKVERLESEKKLAFAAGQADMSVGGASSLALSNDVLDAIHHHHYDIEPLALGSPWMGKEGDLTEAEETDRETEAGTDRETEMEAEVDAAAGVSLGELADG